MKNTPGVFLHDTGSSQTRGQRRNETKIPSTSKCNETWNVIEVWKGLAWKECSRVNVFRMELHLWNTLTLSCCNSSPRIQMQQRSLISAVWELWWWNTTGSKIPLPPSNEYKPHIGCAVERSTGEILSIANVPRIELVCAPKVSMLLTSIRRGARSVSPQTSVPFGLFSAKPFTFTSNAFLFSDGCGVVRAGFGGGWLESRRGALSSVRGEIRHDAQSHRR